MTIEIKINNKLKFSYKNGGAESHSLVWVAIYLRF